MTEDLKEAARRLRWHVVAKRVLGDCVCTIEFTSRKLLDPDCPWHQHKDELIEALSAEYLQGCADQRFDWLGRFLPRHA